MRTITDTTLGDFTGEPLEWDGPFRLVECSRALSPSGLPEMDYAVNPYGGCEHGCIYCYAPGHTHSELSEWRVVRVKRNVVDRLAKELPYVQGTVGLGTVTDPYQAAERRFRLTRGCLELLASRGMCVHIHTKSDLVLRDLDLLRDMDAVVGMTITTVDDRISKMTEPGAPLPRARLQTLERLVEEGVDAYALVAPVMSTLEGLEGDLMDALRETGVSEVYMDSLNLRLVDTTRLDRMGIRPSPEAESILDSLCRDCGVKGTRCFGDRYRRRSGSSIHWMVRLATLL
ncbi:MAG: radical SAM protein [Thermoplasmata archaeon]|nr:radical SAM protein [Thermoplasmata archaeon]